MEFWEFLIQKEGDRSWLPLESPSVEILEGRYRIVARSGRINTSTEIRVTHYATAETPPIRRVRKRSSQTNSDGLIVILPFTRLQPGIWELHCTGDLMAELMGENWQFTVQLDVVPQTADTLDDWEPAENLAENVTAAEAIALTPIAPTDVPAAVTAAEAASTEFTEPTEFTESTEHLDDVSAAEVAAREPVPEETESEAPVGEPEAAVLSEANSESDVASETSTQAADRTEPASDYPDIAEVLQQIEQRSEQIVESAFRELADLGATPLSPAEPNEETEPSALPPMQVILEQETFITQRGEPLTLSGRLEFASDQTLGWQPAISELRVRLYDPQTSQILMDEVYPIDNRVPPFPFSGTISLPEHYHTYLVLGELIFQGKTLTGSQQVLAMRSFNVTTDLHELIESIANDFSNAETLPADVLMPEISEPMPATEVQRLNTQLAAFQRSPQQPLPPQLRPANPTRTHASLELPSFDPPQVTQPLTEVEANQLPADLAAPNPAASDPVASNPAASDPVTLEPALEPIAPQLGPDTPESNASPLQQDAAVSLPEPSISTSAADLVLEALDISHGLAEPDEVVAEAQRLPAVELTPPPDLTATPLASSATLDPNFTANSPSNTSDLFFDWHELNTQVPIWRQRQPRPVELSNAPEDVSFRALNLQTRFWTRLQALATNPELSATLGAGASNGTSQTVIQKRRSIGLDAELAADEIVVDDDFAAVPQPGPTDPETAASPEALGLVLPEDEPIPTPRLQLPSGEITAGQPLSITVKLPSLEARVYVKLWLRDRQTRALLVTPRWLIDFVPDGFGNQMTRTEVTVPPGCLKVQFEAIAVEIATQRESDKVMMSRPVVPPDLSPLSLDELEI